MSIVKLLKNFLNLFYHKALWSESGKPSHLFTVFLENKGRQSGDPVFVRRFVILAYVDVFERDILVLTFDSVKNRGHCLAIQTAVAPKFNNGFAHETIIATYKFFVNRLTLFICCQ